MSDTILTSTSLDANGRKVVLNDSIISISYYDASEENWDKNGSSLQSWYTELATPSDTFDSEEVLSDKWNIVNDTSGNVVSQSGNKLNLEIYRSAAKASLSSDSIWRLTGDFEARLYMDWDSYYNEYRGVCDTYLTVGYNRENSARLSFSFNGSSYEYRSLKSINKDVSFFGWTPNGDPKTLASFDLARAFVYLKVVRTSGVLYFYISNGDIDIQVGESINEPTLQNDLFVELGIETSEYNTYKHYLSKVFFTGAITPTKEFFSGNRGPTKKFPDKTILALDSEALSIIDESDLTLWARFLLEEGGPIPDSTSRVSATNGTLFCTTASGIVAVDFDNDAIYKYVDNDRLLATEPVSMRNSSLSFNIDAPAIGTIPVDNFTEVSSRLISGVTYVAASSDTHVVTLKHLASGIAHTQDGPGNFTKVQITPAGTLYWSGYGSLENTGQLSYRTSIHTVLPSSGTVAFSRTSYYGSDSVVNILGDNITSFDVLESSGVELVAVGTTDGLTFIGASPVSPFSGSVTYGVEAPALNPFADPSFETYLGKYWFPEITGFQKGRFATVSTDFPADGSKSLVLYVDNPPLAGIYEAGTYVGAKQTVDLTEVSFVYFDLYYVNGSNNFNLWDFEVTVNGNIVKSFIDGESSFTRLSDSFDVSEYTGECVVSFRIRSVVDITATVGVDLRKVYVDNIRTSIGSPDYRPMPAGNVAVSEVLLQYDGQGKKIYFSTQGGYGAVDLVSNNLDFFTPISGILPDEVIQSADFSRDDDEV
jgi:hypothetical protein